MVGRKPGDDDDMHLFATLGEPLNEFDAVDTGHDDVENGHIGVVRVTQYLEFLPITRAFDIEAELDRDVLDEVAEPRFVVNDE